MIGLYATPNVDQEIRVLLSAAITSVTPARVHLYRRYFTSKNAFVENSMVDVDGKNQLRAAMVYRVENAPRDFRDMRRGRRISESRSYTYELLLYVGLSDADNTEKVLNDIIDALLPVLESDGFAESCAALGCTVEPATVSTIGHALWFDVLCNQAQLRITFTEFR
ncbi:MAG TPA: hypothetical protein PK916_04680 [Bacteroidota bacterium]|nr:hypothetical protein [Bacteroidota bacterium]